MQRQDVTQEVFLAAWRNWDAYRGDGLVLSWLRGIARRKVADHLRMKISQHRPAAAEGLAGVAASSPTPPEEHSLLLAQVMRVLPPECVELLEEKYLEGLSIRQMAEKRARTEKAELNRPSPGPATCSAALFRRLERERRSAMKTFDFEREEEIAAALVEAVKAQAHRPAGLQEAIRERLFGQTQDTTFLPDPRPAGAKSTEPRVATRRLGPRD